MAVEEAVGHDRRGGKGCDQCPETVSALDGAEERRPDREDSGTRIQGRTYQVEAQRDRQPEESGS